MTLKLDIMRTLLSIWRPVQVFFTTNTATKERRNVSRLLAFDQSDKETIKLIDAVIETEGFDKYLERYGKDATATKVQKWCWLEFKYKGDWLLYKMSDYWASIAQTLATRQGDCEDVARVEFAILKRLGLPVFFACGMMKNPDGGHAWVEYHSDRFNYIFFPLDWCYHPDLRGIPRKRCYMKLHDDDGVVVLKDWARKAKYADYWFFCDEKTGYATKKNDMEMMIR